MDKISLDTRVVLLDNEEEYFKYRKCEEKLCENQMGRMKDLIFEGCGIAEKQYVDSYNVYKS